MSMYKVFHKAPGGHGSLKINAVSCFEPGPHEPYKDMYIQFMYANTNLFNEVKLPQCADAVSLKL
jgi:hypothetical protein